MKFVPPSFLSQSPDTTSTMSRDMDDEKISPAPANETSASSTQQPLYAGMSDGSKLHDTSNPVDQEPCEPTSKKVNWLSSWLQNQIKSFNPIFLFLGVKGALPPTIFLAMYRSTPVAKNIGSLGYLVAIISSFSFAMLPRAKFLQALIQNILFTCIGVAFSILGLWSARQAKLHTQLHGSPVAYNSSGAAVCAIFLFFNVFLVNAFRAKFPAMTLSVVMYSILSNVAFTLGYIFPESLPVYYLPKRLLINFLLAFGLAFGVNLVVPGPNSRTVFLISFEAYLKSVSEMLRLHSDFLTTPHFQSEEHEKSLLTSKEKVRAAFVKLVTNKSDAKKEIAYGVLSRDNISDLSKLSRKIAWPLLGVGTIAGIVKEMIRAGSGEITDGDGSLLRVENIHKAIKVLERPCKELNLLCREGIEHILSVLQLGKYAKPSPIGRLFKKPVSTGTDDENARDIGTNAFLARFDAGIESFLNQRKHGLGQLFDGPQITPTQGLFLVLSIEFLLYAIAQEIRSMILFVDDLRQDGSLTRKQFIFPKLRTFRKGMAKLFQPRYSEEVVSDTYGAHDGDIYTSNYTGRIKQTSIRPATDNPVLKFIVSILKSISDFLRSEYASFGLRAAFATLAGTIPAFLNSSYSFFTEYRGVWITITVVLGMSPTTGASILGLIGRALGTIVGGSLAMGVWYMVVGRVPGVIVFSFVVLALHIYFFLQDPRQVASILNSTATFLLVIGYALEVSKIGIATIESTGQRFFPVYELAPFRMLVTLIGVVLAFIFTIFPYPITSKDILRRDVARQFHLLSNMYSLTRTRMGVVILSDGTKESEQLKKSMWKEFYKCVAIQTRCAENLAYTSWEPNLRYRFPKETYAELLTSMNSLFELFLIQDDAMTRMTGNWLHTLSESLGVDFFRSQSNSTISILNILSGSLALDSPLPPYLTIPSIVSFRKAIEERMPEELSLGHVEESGYAVFAALAVSSRLAGREVERCIDLVRSLVGEVDLGWMLNEDKKDT